MVATLSEGGKSGKGIDPVATFKAAWLNTKDPKVQQIWWVPFRVPILISRPCLAPPFPVFVGALFISQKVSI